MHFKDPNKMTSSIKKNSANLFFIENKNLCSATFTEFDKGSYVN